MLQLLQTSDGSHTIKNLELDETYHSIHGAIQESNHVFIKHGLNHLIENFQTDTIKILEVGFGTGLNALLTGLNMNSSDIPIVYDAVEAFPLLPELFNQLNYPACIGTEQSRLFLQGLHEAKWNESQQLTPNFAIRKIHIDIQKTMLEKEYYDIVYFDAFAPNKQPELWDMKVLELIVRSLKFDRIFVTYSAKGQLKRDLKNLEMEVETLPGPPGKAQMVRAKKSKY